MESTYTTKQGDVWDKIAYEVYGTGTRWTVIYEANRDTIRVRRRRIHRLADGKQFPAAGHVRV